MSDVKFIIEKDPNPKHWAIQIKKGKTSTVYLYLEKELLLKILSKEMNKSEVKTKNE